MKVSKRMPLRNSDGYTLVELLIILVVLAVIAAIAIANLHGAYDRSKQGATVADMRSIASAIEAYSVDNSGAPVASGNIEDLVEALRPYCQSGIPESDHWGHVYVYTSGPSSYSVTSFGKDGLDGPDLTWETRREFHRDIVVSNGVFVAGPEVR
jgi:general secretion pathway protein G